MKKLIYLLTLFLFYSCHQEQTIPVEIDVAFHIKDENHTTPLLVGIENKTKNASNFLWTFEGGEPATSNIKNPEIVKFTTPGEHKIILEAWNNGNKNSKIYTIRVDSSVTLNFKAEAEINNYAPAVFKIENLSIGASTYKWTFEGGEPAVYDGQHPPIITYKKEGKFTISLLANNGSKHFTLKKDVEVGPLLAASFSIIPSFEDEDDFEAPLRATFSTQLQGVKSMKWECTGAQITNESSVDAHILFPKEGEYTVYLNISNGKETKRIPQTIKINKNTNLRTHKDIKLGISTAQESIGCLYSTKLRRGFKSNEVNDNNEGMIDIAFVGFDTQFKYNKFVSPDALDDTPLATLPHAKATKFINKIELGNLTLTSQQFESMTTDALLKDLAISSANYGDVFFDNSLIRRIILFQTADGRKGAILIKQMISKGALDSYIIVDIKVQKK